MSYYHDVRFDGAGPFDEPAREADRFQRRPLTAEEQQWKREYQQQLAEARRNQKRDEAAAAAQERTERGGLPDSSRQNPSRAVTSPPFRNLRSR